MKVIFETDTGVDRNTAKVVTHPEEQEHWSQLEEAIQSFEKMMVVMNPKNDRSVQIRLSTVAVIQSEDRMCSVRLITGEMYLLSQRLKYVEESLASTHLIKINNQTIINTSYIQEFSSSDHARIKVVLKDGSSYYVSRFYIKQFRGKLS